MALAAVRDRELARRENVTERQAVAGPATYRGHRVLPPIPSSSDIPPIIPAIIKAHIAAKTKKPTALPLARSVMPITSIGTQHSIIIKPWPASPCRP
jgi:hypothetical protein